MKKVLMVSNSWRPADEQQICGKCGSLIEYSWGDYSFRYYEEKDKSDLAILCKKCAVELKNHDKQVKVVNRSFLMDLISMKNSGWKPQPKQKSRWGSGGSVSDGGSAGEINPDNKEDADK